MPVKPVKIFISYVNKDKKLVDKLHSHLSLLKRNKLIDIWDEEKLPAGSNGEEETLKHFEDAKIILCYLSADYLASDRHYNRMIQAWQRKEEGKVRFIPILLKPVVWQQIPFSGLIALPRGDRPISTNTSNKEKIILETIIEIKKVVDLERGTA